MHVVDDLLHVSLPHAACPPRPLDRLASPLNRQSQMLRSREDDAFEHTAPPA
jgi:hypothetical protein